MNVFATLKTVFFGSKFLSSPVSTERTLRRDLVSALNGVFERMKSAHPSVMRGMTAYSLSRILPQLGERVHTAKGNVYRVVAC